MLCRHPPFAVGKRIKAAGAVFLFITTRAGAQYPFLRVDGASLNATLGHAVAALGDVNGDDVADYAVGAPDWTGIQGPGAVHVYSGATNLLLYSILGSASGNSGSAGDSFGAALARVADVDGDAIDDLLVGEPYDGTNGQFQAGRAFLYSGASGTLLLDILPPTYSPPAGYFGASLADAGDVNRDGWTDALIGAPVLDKAFVIDLQNGAVLHTFTGSSTNRLGVSVTGLGDVDGDGVPDLAIGEERTHTVYAYSGATGSVLWSVTRTGNFGTSVSVVDDLDADGVNDLVAGAPYADYAELLSGASGASLGSFNGPLGSFFGHVVAGISDMNGDSVRDFIVGGPLHSQSAGGAWVYSGATQALLFTESGEVAGDEFGYSLADFATTPCGNLLIGARMASFGAMRSGSMYRFSYSQAPLAQALSVQRTEYRTPVSVTITGKRFSFGAQPTVRFGDDLATNVVVVNDSTITCDAPTNEAGLVSVSVENNRGIDRIAPFAYSPAMILRGDPVIGGTIGADYLCAPGDFIFAIIGFEPPIEDVSFKAWDGRLRIVPFFFLFYAQSFSDTFSLSVSIPANPALIGATVELQSLVGPKPFGKPKSSVDASWTNCVSFTIR